MADINLGGLYSQIEREFGAPGNLRLQQDFPDAVNRALRRINRQAGLATRATYTTGTEGEVGLDEDYEDVLHDLVVLQLIRMGQRPRPGGEVDYALLERQMDERIDDIRQDILNQAIEDDTDDETDFIGLGALG